MLNYYIVDVFTQTPFGGAQIAVVVLDEPLESEQMQVLAGELNLSDCVFVSSSAENDVQFPMRVFTPFGERDFGGQATVAAAFVLAHCGLLSNDSENTALILKQQAADINVVISGSGSRRFVQFSLKAQAIVDSFVPDNAALAAALSLEEADISGKRYRPLLVACEQPYLIIPVRSFEAVRKASFNYSEWSNRVASISPASELLLFSTKSDVASSDFHARLLGPQLAPDADPPIASAVPAFVGYLSELETIREGTYAFSLDRGTVATRKSLISVELVHQSGKENEVRLGGPAVLVAEGKISIPKQQAF